MSSTTEIITFSDIYTDFLDRLKLSTSQTTAINLAKRYTNQALRDMHVAPGNRLPWAERRAVLITRAAYTTGTVTIDVDASRTAVTGTSTAWTTTDTFGIANVRAGGKIKLGLEVYEVSAVGGATSLTLASQYVGDDLTDQAYTYYEDEYALASDFLRFVDLQNFSTDLHIPLVGRQEFRRVTGRNDTAGRPQFATHIQLGFSGSTAPRHRIVLSPYPNDQMSIPYWYMTSNLAVSSAGSEQARMTADSDEPIVPIQYRVAIVLKALEIYYRDYKDDVRSEAAKADYVDQMTRLLGDLKVGDDRPQFIVRRRRNYTRTRFDSGNRFDQLRDR